MTIRRRGGDCSSKPIHVFSFRISHWGSRASRNVPGEYRRAITREVAGARFKCTLKIERKMPSANGRRADELVVLQPRDLDHFAVGLGDQNAGVCGYPS